MSKESVEKAHQYWYGNDVVKLGTLKGLIREEASSNFYNVDRTASVYTHTVFVEFTPTDTMKQERVMISDSGIVIRMFTDFGHGTRGNNDAVITIFGIDNKEEIKYFLCKTPLFLKEKVNSNPFLLIGDELVVSILTGGSVRIMRLNLVTFEQKSIVVSFKNWSRTSTANAHFLSHSEADGYSMRMFSDYGIANIRLDFDEEIAELIHIQDRGLAFDAANVIIDFGREGYAHIKSCLAKQSIVIIYDALDNEVDRVCLNLTLATRRLSPPNMCEMTIQTPRGSRQMMTANLIRANGRWFIVPSNASDFRITESYLLIPPSDDVIVNTLNGLQYKFDSTKTTKQSGKGDVLQFIPVGDKLYSVTRDDDAPHSIAVNECELIHEDYNFGDYRKKCSEKINNALRASTMNK